MILSAEQLFDSRPICLLFVELSETFWKLEIVYSWSNEPFTLELTHTLHVIWVSDQVTRAGGTATMCFCSAQKDFMQQNFELWLFFYFKHKQSNFWFRFAEQTQREAESLLNGSRVRSYRRNRHVSLGRSVSTINSQSDHLSRRSKNIFKMCPPDQHRNINI